MQASQHSTIRWLSVRVRILCALILFFSSLLPPYVPKAARAPQEAAADTRQFLLVEDGFLMKSSSLTRQGSRRAYAEGSYHTVKAGESIEKLANRYGIDAQTILWANDLSDSVTLQPGDELLILPVDGVLHTVSRGQTLLRIAELYDVSADVIAQQNNIEEGFIVSGQELIIPDGRPLLSRPTQVATTPTPVPRPSPVEDVDPEPTPTVRTPTPSPAFTPTPSAGVLQKPCSSACFITQYYHGGHFALDMQERGGGPIYAAEAGTVVRSDRGWNGGYGNVIEVDHGNGLVTLYAHNERLHVSQGESVSRGQKIADMGNSGLVYGPTGIHVHFEVRVHGVKKNPLLYIE